MMSKKPLVGIVPLLTKLARMPTVAHAPYWQWRLMENADLVGLPCAYVKEKIRDEAYHLKYV